MNEKLKILMQTTNFQSIIQDVPLKTKNSVIFDTSAITARALKI